MPDKQSRQAVAKDRREGKSASTQAGEYVHEEIEHVRQGRHGARSMSQACRHGSVQGATRRGEGSAQQIGQQGNLKTCGQR